jgi:hypothetical protein
MNLAGYQTEGFYQDMLLDNATPRSPSPSLPPRTMNCTPLVFGVSSPQASVSGNDTARHSANSGWSRTALEPNGPSTQPNRSSARSNGDSGMEMH